MDACQRSRCIKFGANWPGLLLSQIISFTIVAIVLQKFAYKPILKVLEERRQTIKQGLENAEKIKQQLAESEARYTEILAKANAEAQKLIDEARASASVVAERKQQQAIADAEQIIAKAREATALEHDRILSELKREVGPSRGRHHRQSHRQGAYRRRPEASLRGRCTPGHRLIFS